VKPKSIFSLVVALTILFPSVAWSAEPPQKDQPDAVSPETLQAFKARLLAATTRHLNLLLGADGSVVSLKGKTAAAQEAMAFHLLFELTGDQKYRRAALTLADRILQDMRATKFGVLPIKEKDKPGGAVILGGGPPALGFYTSRTAYVLHQAGGRNNDLKYLASVLDQFPWNEDGWWSADIDVKTGESKVPLTKPSPINKNAAVAMAAGIVGEYVREIDPPLAARLKQKADKCISTQIIPAQEADGFWHYGLTGNDPKNKDVLGYFMLTTHVLMELQKLNPAYREARLNSAVHKAQAFALRCIAPMTAPNNGPACREHATPATPSHYTLEDDFKRGFELGFILIGSGNMSEGLKIMDASMRHFPFDDAGQGGARAGEFSALVLSGL
jgi:hypothetical protein